MSQVKRRKRTSLVCDACRRKKIRCDKLQPCSQCVRADAGDACVYNDAALSQSALQTAQLPYIASAKNPIALAGVRADASTHRTELDLLKDRLQQLESALHRREPPPPTYTVPSQPPPPAPYTVPQGYVPTPAYSAPKAYSASSYTPPVPSVAPAPPQGPFNYYPKLSNPLDVQLAPPALAVSPEKTPGSVSSQSTASDVSSMNGMNPYRSPDDGINFYEGYTSVHVKEKFRRLTFGPFAWSSLMKKDSGLKLLWDYTVRKKEQAANQALVFTAKPNEVTLEAASVLSGKLTDNSDKVFKRRALQPDGASDLMPYQKLKEAAERNLEDTVRSSTLPLGLTYTNGKIERELRLIDKINLFMPKQKVVWMLIDRFFIHVYPFMPFLDEACFRSELRNIIGEKGLEMKKIEDIRIERRLDLATIGTLFVVLRLSYLALFSNSSDINESRINSNDQSLEGIKYRYLLNNPISINIIDIAQECLDEFDLYRQPAFPVLQLALYLRLYHTYAPEDGDGADGGDSHIMLAVLVRMAMSLGLNREPDNFPELDNEQPLNHLGRKIWYHLAVSDLHLGYSFGTPLLIDPDSFDTKKPFVRSGSESIADKKLDHFITENYYCLADMSKSLRTLLLMVLKVEGKANMAELCKHLTDFEIFVGDYYGTLATCINPSENDPVRYYFLRVFKTKIYLAFKAFLIVIYFYFYQYYESKNIGLSFFYIKKVLLICVGDIMPHFFELIDNVYSCLMFNPTFEAFIHKANQVLISLIVRVNFIIYDMKIRPEHDRKCGSDSKYRYYYRSLCRLSSALTRCLEVSIAVISKISNRYYYAWRVTKGHTYLLRAITKKEFYEENYESAGNLCTPLYSIEQVEDLVNICEFTLTKLGRDDKKSLFKLEVAEGDRTPSENGDDKAKPKKKPAPAPTPTPNADYANIKVPDDSFNMDFVNNAEIDKLWLEMLTMKQGKNNDETNAEGLVGAEGSPGWSSISGSFQANSPGPDLRRAMFGHRDSVKPTGNTNFVFDQATEDGFDLFSEVIPLDQIFTEP